MYRIRILMEYAKGLFRWALTNESLRKIFYELAISKVIYGNKHFKNWPKTKAIVEYLEIAQNAIDKTMKLADISLQATEKEAKAINEQNSGPLKDTVAKVHKNKHGAANHGIDLGIRAEIDGKEVQFGIGFDGSKKIKFGPFRIDF